MKLRSVSLEPFDIRLATDLRTSAGSIGDRSGIAIRLESDDGVTGEGEAAPVPGRPSAGLDAMAGTLHAWAGQAEGADIDTLLADLDSTPLEGPSRFGVHTAIVDLLARNAGVPLHQFLRSGANPVVATSALVSSDSPAEVHDSCRTAVADGFGAVKLKVAAVDPSMDVTRIIAASEACGADVELRLDANHGWTADQVEFVVGRVGPKRLGYIEDPTPDRSDYESLADATGIAIAVDLVEGDVPDRVLIESGARVLVVKAAAIGGIDRLLDAARSIGRDHRMILSSSIDGTVGLLAGLHVAAALPIPDIHGLGTARVVRGIPEFLVPNDGRIELPASPGVGSH